MSFDVLVFLVGVVYGYLSPGKEDKLKLLSKGLRIGIIAGLVFGIITLLTGGGLFFFGASMIGLLVVILIYTVIFIAGTIVGDFLESKLKK